MVLGKVEWDGMDGIDGPISRVVQRAVVEIAGPPWNNNGSTGSLALTKIGRTSLLAPTDRSGAPAEFFLLSCRELGRRRTRKVQQQNNWRRQPPHQRQAAWLMDGEPRAHALEP